MTAEPNGSSDLGPYVASVVKGRIAGTRGVTTTSFARKIDMSRDALSSRTNGRVPMTSNELDIMALNLGTTASEIMREAERRRLEASEGAAS